MFYVQEGQNDIRRSLQIIDRKLNGLRDFLQAMPSNPINPPAANETDESADIVRLTIRRMASVRPDERAKTNYVQCLDVMGFPITTSLEDVSVIITSLSCNVIVACMLLQSLSHGVVMFASDLYE